MSGSLKLLKGTEQKKVNVYFTFSQRNLYLIPAQREAQESLIVPLNKISAKCSSRTVRLTFSESDNRYKFSFDASEMDQKLWARLNKSHE
ncbi:hypothetical protein I6N96_05460 [Enterococcus sp. BWM-S5]|uniref:PH domain-containing protein n=1 Tax=Enterococcus larvae TaxID=2794352 RepID=A0ABS4CH01_9ENTE|nr:hypothetical protein [Enterococcus larvae]MBP1045718.1 hypothetical protein [Enterococcus larvae]